MNQTSAKEVVRANGGLSDVGLLGVVLHGSQLMDTRVRTAIADAVGALGGFYTPALVEAGSLDADQLFANTIVNPASAPTVFLHTKWPPADSPVFAKTLAISAVPNSTDFLEFVADVEGGHAAPLERSEPLPEGKTAWGEVETVVGKNLEQMVFRKDVDVLLNVYAPWCGWSQKFRKAYKQLAHMVSQLGLQDLLVVADMDGTANSSPVRSLRWRSFPHVVYVRAKEYKPQKFQGERNAEALLKWVAAHHSQPQVFKGRWRAALAEKRRREALAKQGPDADDLEL
eukprot:gnl/MRDRNA2_/MRDRNA2_35307_c0_seq1.p1 gnl/MRDRNA2_/MRDRNA2_35307_c0~~gnl/MRDRNA2_/MRDRNA2_35307_c0_seq1.p1  ORF type:complete len:285 (+),score=49.63 gnl/MRDRNA2_/MRDRNA2_35307_c0_seq1:3-857(+)